MWLLVPSVVCWSSSFRWLFVQLFGLVTRHATNAAHQLERKLAPGIKCQADLPFDWLPDCVLTLLDLNA